MSSESDISLSSTSSYSLSLPEHDENTDDGSIDDFEYDDSLEPVANEQELSEYLEQVAIEQDEEEEFGKRLSGEVSVESWCTCSKCSLELVFKPAECICCHEMMRCIDKMEEEQMDTDACIIDHPGFGSNCLDKYVLELAAIGLKTRKKKSYSSIYKNGNKPEAQFLRSVSYRQAFRLVWEYAGNDVRKPLPSCIYNAIRGKFPSDDGNYKGYQEEEDETEDELNVEL